jgi:hypothetical protein
VALAPFVIIAKAQVGTVMFNLSDHRKQKTDPSALVGVASFTKVMEYV